ncbi:MAG: hypothetical protein U0359_03655 [Byssovorax sp.]
MKRASIFAPLAFASLALAGCSHGLTTYTPKLVAQDELLLRYDDHFEVYTAERPVAEGVRYTGLADFVRCVPDAHRHALAAESDGATGFGLSVAGGTSAVLGLGGLSGLAFYNNKDSTPMVALLGGGIALEVAGLVMAILSRGYKGTANGHAVDAVNYYNDALGSLGGSCDRPLPAAPAPPAPASTAPTAPPALAPRVDAPMR